MESKIKKSIKNDEIEQNVELISKPGLDQKKNVEETFQKKKNLSNYYGLIYALLAAIFLSMSNVLIKMANFFSGTDIGFMRFIIQLITMAIIGIFTKTKLLGTREIRKNLILYGIFQLLLILFLLISIKFIAPSESSALFQLNMIMVPIIARVFLKEKFRIIFIVSLIISITGVIFIAQPSFLFKQKNDFIHFNTSNINITNVNISKQNKSINQMIGFLSALLSAFFCAVGFVHTKVLVNLKVHYSVLSIYTAFIGIPACLSVSLIMYYTGFQTYDMNLMADVSSICLQIFYAISSGVCATLVQLFLNLAVIYIETLKVSMVFSNSLLFTFLFQYLLLNLKSNLLSSIGAVLIFLSTLSIIFVQIFEKLAFKGSKNKNDISLWKRCLFFKM